MRFASLGSGSRGNATVVEGGGTRVLVDCGFPAREAQQRMGALGVAPESLHAILVTHEHGDHLRGVGALARRYGLPVWMTVGTQRHGGCGDLPDPRSFSAHQGGFSVGDLYIEPFTVPHDAREPVQFCLRAQGLRLGILTDTGAVTPHLAEAFADCDALVVECNHDPELLAAGPYPPALRERVGGALGHLSNRQAAALVARLDGARLRHLVGAHLSEKNNRPELAKSALLEASPTLAGCLALLDQERVSPWFEL